MEKRSLGWLSVCTRMLAVSAVFAVLDLIPVVGGSQVQGLHFGSCFFCQGGQKGGLELSP